MEGTLHPGGATALQGLPLPGRREGLLEEADCWLSWRRARLAEVAAACRAVYLSSEGSAWEPICSGLSPGEDPR